jgi:two-component system, LytTR family, sensor kinase
MERLANYILQLYPIDHVPFKRRVVLHGIFWGIYFFILMVGVGIPSDTIAYRFIAAISSTLTSMVFFYGITYLIPYLYSKYTGIIMVLAVTLVAITFYFFLAIEIYGRLVFVVKNSQIFIPNKIRSEIYNNVYEAGFWSYFRISNILTNTIQLLFTTLPAFFLKFTRIFTKIFSEKKQLEIDFLRLQINPHFLVNTLNNIYSLVVIEDQRSPNAILSLSNLLNYVLYESSMPTVSIKKEIQFLQDFVALEKIRNSSKIQVKMNVEGEQTGDITPLILIAFIENAFKHGVADSTIQSYIHINIKVENNTLCLSVINSKVRKVSEKQKKSLGGIGLVNVQKRLNSLYSNRYDLQVISEPNKYQIVLVIVLT